MEASRLRLVSHRPSLLMSTSATVTRLRRGSLRRISSRESHGSATTSHACAKRSLRWGESDPDALIADRLSEPALTGGQDFATSAGDTSENVVPKDVSEQVQVEIEAAIDLPVTEQESVSDRAAGPESLLWSDAESGVLSDRPSVLGPDETSPGVFDLFQVVDDGPAVSAEQEIDLTSVLSDLSPEESTRAEVVPTSHEADAPVLSNETTPAPEGQPVHASANLQEVSQRLGEDVVSVVSQETDDATCGEQYQLGLTYRQMGMVDEAIQALEAAVRSPQHRFGAGLLLGRMYQERGMGGQAVAWLEIASQIPAPRWLKMAACCCTSSVRALEAVGETVRALAVFLELQSGAGEYRDVAKRVERLSRVETGS